MQQLSKLLQMLLPEELKKEVKLTKGHKCWFHLSSEERDLMISQLEKSTYLKEYIHIPKNILDVLTFEGFDSIPVMRGTCQFRFCQLCLGYLDLNLDKSIEKIETAKIIPEVYTNCFDSGMKTFKTKAIKKISFYDAIERIIRSKDYAVLETLHVYLTKEDIMIIGNTKLQIGDDVQVYDYLSMVMQERISTLNTSSIINLVLKSLRENGILKIND